MYMHDDVSCAAEGSDCLTGGRGTAIDEREMKARIGSLLLQRGDRISLSLLAQELGYSRRHTCRLVRRYYNMTFPEMLNRRRQEMVERLRKEGVPIKDAVRRAGYSSVGYYRRVKRKLSAEEGEESKDGARLEDQ